MLAEFWFLPQNCHPQVTQYEKVVYVVTAVDYAYVEVPSFA